MGSPYCNSLFKEEGIVGGVDKVRLSDGEYVRIEGPAMVEVLRGSLYLLGARYETGAKVTILRARRVVAKAISDTELSLVLGPGGFADKPKAGEEMIDEWDSKLNISLKGSVVVVMGAMDSGKTTITTILVNKAASMGLKVGVVDADPGQNDLGPPTTITCSVLKSGRITHLSFMIPLRQVFIGSTNLEGNWHRAVYAVTKLVDYLRGREGADLIVVNTDGWVEGEGAIEYKRALVTAVKPSYVIVMRKGDEVDGLVKGLSQWNTLVLNAPPSMRVRDRNDRKIHRDMGYGRYLSPSRDLTLSLSQVNVVNMPITGRRLDERLARLISTYLKVKPIYVDALKNMVMVVSSSVKEPTLRSIPGGVALILQPNWENGLLVGLEDVDGFLVSLAVLRRIYYNAGKIVVTVPRRLSNAELASVRSIRVGSIRVNEQFEEVDKFSIIYRVERILSDAPFPSSQRS